VTHDMDFARNATTVHVLEAGRIARSGTPESTLRD
jgi:ABC-type histidine transport system ATPase subunit